MVNLADVLREVWMAPVQRTVSDDEERVGWLRGAYVTGRMDLETFERLVGSVLAAYYAP